MTQHQVAIAKRGEPAPSRLEPVRSTASDDPDDGDVDGRAQRAAQDQPGRHGGGFGGLPGGTAPPPSAVRTVSPGQGTRSFGGTRKRPV